MSRIGVNFSDDELQEMVQVKKQLPLTFNVQVKKKQIIIGFEASKVTN